jgi:hypothetical protein
MSFGSRATRQNLKRLSSFSEQLYETASFFAGDRRFVSVCVRRFPKGKSFSLIPGSTRIGAQNGAEFVLRGRNTRDHASRWHCGPV